MRRAWEGSPLDPPVLSSQLLQVELLQLESVGASGYIVLVDMIYTHSPLRLPPSVENREDISQNWSSAFRRANVAH